jgi:hypothetical protein
MAWTSPAMTIEEYVKNSINVFCAGRKLNRTVLE